MATIALGQKAEVEKLFSFPPPAPNSNQTLQDLVKHYIQSSVTRDEFTTSQVTVNINGNNVSVDITGPAGVPYTTALPAFIAAGTLALNDQKSLVDNGRWQQGWTFFLPLGLAFTQHKSVQLLHFPPDTVMQSEDYLGAETLKRWAMCLVAGGAAAAETALYQNVIDIAPIATKASAGNDLTHANVYRSFSDYIKRLLNDWVPKNGKPRPLVAFGVPVRGWIESEMLNGQTLTVVPQLVTIKLSTIPAVPTVLANHPSLIFNTARTPDNPATPQDERERALIAVMIQDMIAAEWEVRMTQSAASPDQTFTQSDHKWNDPAMLDQVKRLIEEQVRPHANTPPAMQVLDRVKALPKPKSAAEYAASHERGRAFLQRLRTTLGSSDGDPMYMARLNHPV
jgi:hypothetical protein